AQPAALLLLVSEKLSDREPFEWFLEFAFMRRNHTSKRGREFRTKRDFAFAFVCEIEKLLDNFRAAFFLVQLGRLQRRTFPFDESVVAGDPPPPGGKVNLVGTGPRQGNAKTGERMHKESGEVGNAAVRCGHGSK